MSIPNISVHQLQRSDHQRIVDYFLNANKDFLTGMGVAISKLPSREEWLKILSADFDQPLEKKKFFYVIWLLNDEPIGHSNINKIIFGEEAYMHLHLWRSSERQKGSGIELMKLTLPYYFNLFHLKNLYCEPSASNPGPNKVLQKLDFELLKTYDTTPGWINSFQTVNRWVLTKERFDQLYSLY